MKRLWQRLLCFLGWHVPRPVEKHTYPMFHRYFRCCAFCHQGFCYFGPGLAGDYDPVLDAVQSALGKAGVSEKASLMIVTAVKWLCTPVD